MSFRTCETYRDVVVTNDLAKRYELDVERGRAEIASTLKRLDRLHMIALLDSFITALERDLIDAADFAPRLSPSGARAAHITQSGR